MIAGIFTILDTNYDKLAIMHTCFNPQLAGQCQVQDAYILTRKLVKNSFDTNSVSLPHLFRRSHFFLLHVEKHFNHKLSAILPKYEKTVT